MSLVPKHIKELKPYVAGKSKKEFKRKFGNKEPIKLASNENPLGCSPKSIDKLDNHINNCNRYPDSSGFELRKKLADIYDLDMNNVIIGSGAIGVEFAYFYNSIGTEVTIIEYQDNIVPVEDKDISRQLAKDFKSSKIKILTNTGVEKVEIKNRNVLFY